MSKPKLFLATDHAGFEYKNSLRDYLIEHNSHGYEVVDLGPFVYDPVDDYPYLIARAASRVAKNPVRDRAIIFGGSGQGEAIVANKHNGVRATVYYGGNKDIIALGREHNDTNVLSFGARFVDEREMFNLAQEWLVTPFSQDERHARRINQVRKLEDGRFWRRFIDLVRPAK